MAGEGYALAREELIRTLTAYSGITTADGSSNKNTLIDSALIGKNDFLTGKSILIMSGDAQYETAGITDFDSNTGEITFTPLSVQIVAGVSFRVLNVLPESVHISSGQVQIQGYDYASGEYRLVAVNVSGQIEIKATVADIVTARVSGVVAVVSGEIHVMSGQVDVSILSGEAIKISGETVIAKVSGETIALASGTGPVLAKVSGETVIAKVSGEKLFAITASGDYVVVSGEVISKVSGETVIGKISGETVIAKVSGETVIAKVSGEKLFAITASGDYVVVSGEVISKVSGETVIGKISGETVIAKVSGETVIAKVSGQSVVVTSGQVGIKGYELLSGDWRNILVNASGQIIARISGDVVKISGETITAKVSGETVSLPTTQQVIAKISGETVSLPVSQIVKVSGETIIAKVSGETVSLPTTQVVKISGEIVSLPTTQQVIAKVSGETVSLPVSQVVKVSGEIIIAKVSGETVSIAVPTAIVHFQQTIPDSATQLTAGAVKSAVVKALTANSGMIYMGDSDVSIANGFELDAGEAASADIDNTSRLYAIASVSGDKICALGVN